MNTATEANRKFESPALTDQEVEMARVAQRFIVAALDHSRAASITLTSDTGDAPVVQVPPQALRFIAQVLGAMSDRRPVMLMPARQEMSTIEAANFLNVSRPFVTKQIEAGRLPCRKVGTHRRIPFEALVRYADEMRNDQQDALDRMAKNAQDLGLNY
jgi:excisionase family DNA binding protein